MRQWPSRRGSRVATRVSTDWNRLGGRSGIDSREPLGGSMKAFRSFCVAAALSCAAPVFRAKSGQSHQRSGDSLRFGARISSRCRRTSTSAKASASRRIRRGMSSSTRAAATRGCSSSIRTATTSARWARGCMGSCSRTRCASTRTTTSGRWTKGRTWSSSSTRRGAW